MTDPTLPVQHGDEITLTCPADHIKRGGNKATCLDAQLVPTTAPPQCSATRMLQVYDQFFLLLAMIEDDSDRSPTATVTIACNIIGLNKN